METKDEFKPSDDSYVETIAQARDRWEVSGRYPGDFPKTRDAYPSRVPRKHRKPVRCSWAPPLEKYRVGLAVQWVVGLPF